MFGARYSLQTNVTTSPSIYHELPRSAAPSRRMTPATPRIRAAIDEATPWHFGVLTKLLGAPHTAVNTIRAPLARTPIKSANLVMSDHLVLRLLALGPVDSRARRFSLTPPIEIVPAPPAQPRHENAQEEWPMQIPETEPGLAVVGAVCGARHADSRGSIKPALAVVFRPPS